MFIKKFYISKSEECPCGSGMRYKDCCKGKADEAYDVSNKKKVMVDVAKMFDSNKFETCLHPEKSKCKYPIKKAHAIQNHGVLSQISHKNHVIAFPTNKTEVFKFEEPSQDEIHIIRRPKSIGVNKATIHTCFCNYHDSKVFQPIESNPSGFDKNDEEQLFLYAYKAFAFEYYIIQVEMNAIRNMFKRFPQKLRKYPFLFLPIYRRAELKSKDFDVCKSIFDDNLVNGTYDSVYSEVIELPYKIEFSTVECIAPMYDCLGNPIKSIRKGVQSKVFITIFPDGQKSHILLSCLKKDYCIYKKYFDSIKALSDNDKKEYFSTMLPLYSENIVINPLLWRKWGETGQYLYSKLTNIMGNRIKRFEKKLAKTMRNSLLDDRDYPSIPCNLFEEI